MPHRIKCPVEKYARADNARMRHVQRIAELKALKVSDPQNFDAKELRNAQHRHRYSIDVMSRAIGEFWGMGNRIETWGSINAVRKDSRPIGIPKNANPKKIDRKGPLYILKRNLTRIEEVSYNTLENSDEKEHFLRQLREDDLQEKKLEKEEEKAEDEIALTDRDGKVLHYTTDPKFTNKHFRHILENDTIGDPAEIAYNDAILPDCQKYTGTPFKVPADTEQRSLTEWWDYEFGTGYYKLELGYLAEKLECHPQVEFRHNVDYFLPNEYIAVNKIISYQKWKESLPGFEQLGRKVTLYHRYGLLNIPVDRVNEVQDAIEKMSDGLHYGTKDNFEGLPPVEYCIIEPTPDKLDTIFRGIMDGYHPQPLSSSPEMTPYNSGKVKISVTFSIDQNEMYQYPPITPTYTLTQEKEGLVAHFPQWYKPNPPAQPPIL